MIKEFFTQYEAVVGPAGSILLAAILATTGWIYTARRQRALARRQLSFDVLQRMSLDPTLRSARQNVSNEIRSEKGLPENWEAEIEAASEKEKKRLMAVRDDLRIVLNNYETMAANIRRGDMVEYMLKDTQRGSFISTFQAAEFTIDKTRQSRANKRIYEHMEWLYDRWTTNQPGPLRASLEWLRGKPFFDQQSYAVFVGVAAFLIITLVSHLAFALI